MAGKRQHYVWQLLQRGFGRKSYGDHHIWVYRKNSKPTQTVTRSFGVSKAFYGPEGSKADANITDFENRMQSFIQEARVKKMGEEIDRDMTAEIISHLEMRSLFIRNEISRLGKRVLTTLEGILSSPKGTRELFIAVARSHPEMLDEALDREAIPDEMRPLAHQMFEQLVSGAISDASSDLAQYAKIIITPLIEDVAVLATDAHNRSLRQPFSEVERTIAHRSLRYFVYHIDEGNLILPDTHLAFFKDRGCAPVSQKGDRIEAVVFPISSQVAIIGKSDLTFERDRETILRVLASCAYEAFLAPEKTLKHQKLASRISRNAKLISDAEIARVVNPRNLFR